MTGWAVDGTGDTIDALRHRLVPNAHRQLEDILDHAKGESSRPTRLPGWTLGHLVAHLRLNAESHIRVLDAARSGLTIDQYEGGSKGRAAAIEHDSTRPLHDLIRELHEANQVLEATWESMTEQDWRQPTRMRAGDRPAHVSLWARWRETLLHAVDLDLGYCSDDWPSAFATAGIDINVNGDEMRPLHERLPSDTVVALTDSTRTWTSQPDRIITHTAHGTAQALLGWIVQRPATTPPSWDIEPALDTWP